jgi:hypothetical protein
MSLDYDGANRRYAELLGRHVVAELQKRGFEALYCADRKDVRNHVLSLIPAGAVVSCGGSATLHELDLITALTEKGCQFLDPNAVSGSRAKEEMARRALNAEFYLMSTNALTMSGELVNLDGLGNRVAALAFGPRRVVGIAGLNKIVPDLDAALSRARTEAAARTLLLFKKDFATYVELAESCERSYSHTVVTRKSWPERRITVIVVGDRLGF